MVTAGSENFEVLEEILQVIVSPPLQQERIRPKPAAFVTPSMDRYRKLDFGLGPHAPARPRTNPIGMLRYHSQVNIVNQKISYI